MAINETEILEGVVENIVYTNKENGFTVLDLSSNSELISVVGEFMDLQEGEELKITGFYTSHPTYGHQFKAQLYERSLPVTSIAIRKYLASGVVKGIGPAIAKRIVDKFGDETLKVIEDTPERLAEIKGITKARCDELADEFRQIFGVRTLMLFLASFNVSPAQTVKIWKRWGVLAVDIIKANPYKLCDYYFQIDFKTADKLAISYGFETNDYSRILAGLRFVLMYNLNNGHTCLPQDKLVVMAQKLLEIDSDDIIIALDEIIENEDLTKVSKSKEFIALNEYYRAENYISSRVQLMTIAEHDYDMKLDLLIDNLQVNNGIEYETLQRQAMMKSMKYDVMILTGGPGTGKTTTLNGIIELFEAEEMKVLIAAPTGRAAKRISEVTDRKAKTIHRMLEVEFNDGDVKFKRNEEEPLDADAIIIDEMSMVDVMLFEALLRAIRPNCKLILVGDYNQLPSVGAGNVLQDLLESDIIPCVKLMQIFRQSSHSLIVTNAHDIVKGEMPNLTKKDSDFFFMSRQSANAIKSTVVELVCQRLPKSYGFSPLEDIQLLCPQRKGDLGVVEFNKLLQEQLNPRAEGKFEFKSKIYTFRENDKVMQIKNNYDIEWTKDNEKDTGIFNGDIGIIRMIDKGSQTMAIDFDSRVAYYTFEMAEELELAYAITIHKSQGSEFEAIVIPIFSGFDKLYYRNLLYTAITRAKKILILVGSENRVEYMVSNNIKNLRFTNLKKLLIESIN